MRCVCFALLAVVSAFLSTLALIADDRDEPSDRKTCGRLVISIVGAGEPAIDPNQSVYETVPGDKHTEEAKWHLLQFTAGSDAILPSKHIVLTSDPELKSWVKRLPFSQKLALAGVVDNSIPAFERMVDPASNDSPLNRAIADFKNNSGCRQLVGKSNNVLPFLKVDIIVDGELAESDKSTVTYRDYGISSFTKEGTIGTFDLWMRDRTVIGKEELSKLMRRLSGSLVHVFVKVCKAGLLGNIFDSAMNEAGICGCYLGVADETQDHYSGGVGARPAFNYAMPKHGDDIQKVVLRDSFGKWAHSNTSMVEMSAALLDQHNSLIIAPLDPESKDTAVVRDLHLHRNPLFGFGYTSADGLTNKALAFLQPDAVALRLSGTPGQLDSAASKLAKQIANSEFMSEIQRIPIKPYKSGASAEVDANLKRIQTLLFEARNQLGGLIDNDSKAKLDTTVFDREIDNFNSCLSNGTPDVCSTITTLFDGMNKKISSQSPLSPDETIFYGNFNAFSSTLSDMKFRKLWKQYISGEISLSDFLSKMSSAKLAYLKFKRGIEPLYKKQSNGQTPEEDEGLQKKQKAFEFLTSSFERAVDSVQSQTFDLLKKEAVTTKLARTEAAINLLAENLSAVEPPGAGEKLIAEMAIKLTCLTRYPVGPAHDRNKPGPTLTISHDQGKQRTGHNWRDFQFSIGDHVLQRSSFVDSPFR